MVSGVDTPSVQGPMVEASTSAALINQARQGAIVNSSQLVVGKQFQAEVVAALTDGTYIVKVADIAARMQLPDSPEVGSKLSLTLLSTSPRATFLLNPPEEEGAESTPMTTNATLGATVRQLVEDFNQSSAGAGSAPTTTSTGLYLQPGTAVAATDVESDPRLINATPVQVDSTPATLSSTGRLVNQLINDAPQEAPLASIAKTPLLSTPNVNVNTMMSALKNGVSSSGVFYESHLLQWAEGSMTTEQLMKEPQASFTTLADPTRSAAQSQSANPATQSAGAASQAQTAEQAIPIALPREATPIIQQQLQTMEQQRFVWHGELWPGQQMEWEIGQQDSDGQSGNGQQESTWQSSVRFELPTLGAISAQLQLTGNHLRLHISTDNPISAVQLQNHAPELANALESAGTKLDSIVVQRRPASATS